MKILKIKGKNLASLGAEFEIDFTREPLASAGVFAITGNTGSGKSTILDAICLALYDSTPRMNKAKETNVQLKDVNDKSISQNDSRSILRRGTAECYAQVEFLATTGDRYRATWSVRRAGNKPSGSLQKVDMSAVNVETGEPLQGTKSDIQARLTELVGLSFEQFSRSVLLAQGDFASFLKAKKDEKAEILEKLTGTEVYSDISRAIYSKAKEAESSRKELLQHIEDVEIISEEEKERLLEEKKERISALDIINRDEEKYRNSIKWIDDYNQLIVAINEAKENIAALSNEIDQAAPRYDKLAVIDSAQAVRNIYIEQSMAKKQVQEGRILIEKERGNLSIKQDQLKKASLIKENTIQEQQVFTKYVDDIQPELELAHKLDVQIDEAKNRGSDIDADRKRLQEMYDKSHEHIKQENAKLGLLIKKIEELDKWFEHYKSYSSLVPAKDLVVNLLLNYYDSKDQIEKLMNNIGDAKKNIERYESSLSLVKEEAERINSLQPSEVIILRKRLEKGMPCPVCGSTEHPLFVDTQDNSFKEEELEKQKERANKEIERVTLMLENSRKELIRLSSSIESYENHKNSSFEKVQGYVSILPNWNGLLESGRLKDTVEKFVSLWNDNTKLLAANKELLSGINAGIGAAEREKDNLNSQLDEKKKTLNNAVESYKELEKKRNGLLSGKSYDEVQRYITEKRSDIDKRVKDSNEKESSLKLEVENAKARIEQIDNQNKREVLVMEKAYDKIAVWLSSQQKITSFDELEGIFSKDESWLAAEKSYLSSLNEKYTVASALLKEREGKRIEHENSPSRTLDDESSESIKEKLDLLLQEKSNIGILLAQIEVRLENDQKNRKKVEAYKKEYDSKSEYFQSWANLNDLFGSQSGNKFKEIAQEYTLDILVMYANSHLKDLAPRYELERIQDTLALQIADLDMMGEKRSVHSLSGGESFLVSLALALGLSSISSNRMNVESLFIDEGFGSLDIDTLRIAMDALESLQMQGRKIGVISHVSEMTERINARIMVTKEGSGRSVISVE